MSSPSRSVARKAFAALLETALVGVGKPAQAVYDHFVGDFGGMTSVLVVQSGPAERERSDMSGSCWKTTAHLFVHTFTPYAEPDSGWTEADAEDKMDELEAAVAEVVLANQFLDGVWSDLNYDDTGTEPGTLLLGGKAYRSEVIPLTAEILE